jgi:hypothetical protein
VVKDNENQHNKAVRRRKQPAVPIDLVGVFDISWACFLVLSNLRRQTTPQRTRLSSRWSTSPLLLLVFLRCVQDGRSALRHAPLVWIRAICALTPTEYFTTMLGIRMGGWEEGEELSSGLPLLPSFNTL